MTADSLMSYESLQLLGKIERCDEEREIIVCKFFLPVWKRITK